VCINKLIQCQIIEKNFAVFVEHKIIVDVSYFSTDGCRSCKQTYFNIEIIFRKELEPGKYFLPFNYFPRYKYFQPKTTALEGVC
jgi:hypothetical protein